MNYPPFKITLAGILTGMLVAAFGLGFTARADGHAVKMGVILGFSGPIESLTPNMAASAELAWKEISKSGKFLKNKSIVPVRADSTCVDSQAATTAADRLVYSDKVAAIYGADCSGVTTAIATNVAIAANIVMISPSATSPALSDLNSGGTFYRTAPSDARQGEILAGIVMDRGIKSVAVTYTKNDYGKGLSDSFNAAYKKLGGKIAINIAHEDGKSDYMAEVASLSASGADTLAVFGYLDQGGRGIIRDSIESGAFELFVLGDGMIGQALVDNIGKGLEGTFGTMPGGEGKGQKNFLALAKNAGFDGSGPYCGESYDAAAILALAAQAAGSADRAAIKSKIKDVANAPGEKILPGELDKALRILAKGGKINYEGATAVEFFDNGDVGGVYQEMIVKNGAFRRVKSH